MKSVSELYILVIESIILEAMSLEDIYEKYYKNDVKKWEDFREILYTDPTSMPKEAHTDPHVRFTKKGKYLDWIIKKCYKVNKQRYEEDAYKIKEDLTLFDKNYRHINKQITQIKDASELSKLVREFREKKEAGEIDLSRSEIKKDIEKVYDDGTWLIIRPKTKEAAKYYGANTRWCTAAEEEEKNYFDFYNRKGPLYIVINKKVPSEKYQFHFKEEQYMNSEDEPIEDFKIFPDVILDKLVEKAEEELSDDYDNEKFIHLLTYFLYNTQIPQENDIKKSRYYSKYKKEIDKYVGTIDMTKYVQKGDIDRIKEALDDGADLTYNIYNAFTTVIVNNNMEIFKMFLNTDIFKGVDTTYISGFKFILRDIAKNNRVGMLRYLVENGYFNITGENEYVWYYNELLKPLHFPEGFEFLDYLLEKGLDIKKVFNTFDNSELIIDNLLWKAFQFSQYETAKKLIDRGASIYNVYKDKGGSFILKYLKHIGSNLSPEEYIKSIEEKEKK